MREDIGYIHQDQRNMAAKNESQNIVVLEGTGAKPKGNVQVNVFDRDYDFVLSNHTTGRELFDQMIALQEIKSVWFFGLILKDSKGVENWLKLNAKIFSQEIGKKRPVLLKFRAKFFPEDVSKEMDDPASKRLFFHQVRSSILEGEVYCPSETAVLLASLAAQVTLGDHSKEKHPPGFLKEERILPKKILDQYDLSEQDWEDKIVTLYEDHKGLSSDNAMKEYLRVAQDLEMFGITFFDIKNKKGTELILGISANGIYCYEKDNKLSPKLGFPWSEIKSIAFNNKKFTIKPRDESAPNFMFIATRVRVNKKILALCMGNHELFIRRRRAGSKGYAFPESAEYPLDQAATLDNFECGPSGEHSTFSASHEDRSAAVPDLEQETGINGHLYENRTSFADQLKEAPIDDYRYSESTSIVRDPVYEDVSENLDNKQAKESFIESIQDEATESNQMNGIAYGQILPEPDLKQEKDEEKQAYINFGDEKYEDEIPGPAYPFEPDIHTSAPPVPPKLDFSSPVVDFGDSPAMNAVRFSVKSLDKSEDNTKISDKLDTLIEEYAMPGEIDIPDQKKSFSQDLHWEMNQQVVDANKPLLENDLHLLTREKYKKLQEIFEELSLQQKMVSREDIEHRQMLRYGLDKYKTLRNIQGGHTRTRIAVFEAM